MKKKINVPVAIMSLLLAIMITVTAVIVGTTIIHSIPQTKAVTQDTKEDMTVYDNARTFNERFGYSNNRIVVDDDSSVEKVYLSSARDLLTNKERFETIGYSVKLFNGKQNVGNMYFSIMGNHVRWVSREEYKNKEYDLYYITLDDVFCRAKADLFNNSNELAENWSNYSIEVNPVYGIVEAGATEPSSTLSDNGDMSGFIYDDTNFTTVSECYVAMNTSKIGKDK